MSVFSEVLIQKEFTKNPEMKLEDIQSIRDWLKQQPHLPQEYITGLYCVSEVVK